MTDQERAIYDRMSDRERRSIDAIRPENRGSAIILWAHIQGQKARRMPSRQEAELAPRREFVDDSEERYP